MEQEPQTVRERAVLLLRAAFLPGWQPPTVTAGQGLVWAIRGAAVLGILFLIATQVDKTLWDWLELLIVPAALAFGAYWLNRRQSERELEVEEQRAQDDVLQTYIDNMTRKLSEYRAVSRSYQESLSKVEKAKSEYQRNRPNYEAWRKYPKEQPPDWEGHYINPNTVDRLEEENKREIASSKQDAATFNTVLGDIRVSLRAQTLAVLDRVGERRKREIMRFISEAGLLRRETPVGESPIEPIPIRDADFSGADLGHMDLSANELQGIHFTGTNLTSAVLMKTRLDGADLSGANLRGAIGITNHELYQQAAFLEGATMPNGQKYEDWLKE